MRLQISVRQFSQVIIFFRKVLLCHHNKCVVFPDSGGENYTLPRTYCAVTFYCSRLSFFVKSPKGINMSSRRWNPRQVINNATTQKGLNESKVRFKANISHQIQFQLQ